MSAARLEVLRCPLDGVNLIEASAGTGKTWNICALYLRLLLERRIEAQGILVVTFTNAATAELRERIRARIADTLQRLRGQGPAQADPFVDMLLDSWRRVHALADADMLLRLEQALHSFDEASIFTIHGFCQRALGDAPFSAGMPMALELLDDDSEMRLEAVHDFWRRRIAGDSLPPELAAHLLACKDTPQRLASLLERQLAKPLSQVLWPESIDQAAPVDHDAIAAALEAARELWQLDREGILGCVSEALPRLNGTRYKAESLARAAEDWDALFAQRDVLAACAELGKLELLSASCLKPKKGQRPPEGHLFFERAQTLLALLEAGRASLALQRLQLLRDLLDEGPRALRRAKRERHVIAFDDMLYNLHERLHGDHGAQLATALRARFPAALIDEFQDTDPLQFAIFGAIHGRGAAPLFLVGDPKQAIYSFRSADLHTYLRARDLADAEYTLAENQRSTRPLLAGLNALFAANPRAFMLPGLDYRAVDYGAKPRAQLDDASAPRAPLQCWSLPRDGEGLPLLKDAARQAAVTACSGEVARLLVAAQRGQIRLDGQPLAGRHIAVLVRSHAQGSAMRRALAALGVGSVELSQASVHASPDALELEALLAAILEPAREPLLRAALATTLMGLDASAVDAVSQDESSLLRFIARFAQYRATWLRRGVGLMLRQLVAGEGIGERLLARPDGERRMTNLLHLGERLNEAAQEHPAPEALLRWLQTQRTDGRSDEASQLRLESDRNLVQIVTIHKSKGLEYPIVFCPFLWDGHPGMSDGLEGREYHDAQGRAVLDWRTLDKSTEAAVKAQAALERAAENLRLMYVALTRAVQRCYLVVGPYSRRTAHGTSFAESRHAVLNWLVAGGQHAPADWLQNNLEPQAIDTAWAALADAQAPHIGLAPLPQDVTAPLQADRPAPETLAAREAPRHIPAGWRLGSYSSLTQGARHEGAALDHDLRMLRPIVECLDGASQAEADVREDDILLFPRGPEAGECLHAVFERIDFCDAAGWPAAIDAALRLHPQAQQDVDTAPLPTMLRRMLGDVLRTPLQRGMRLAQVPRARRLVELEFSLPSRQLSASGLAAVLRAQGYPAPPLSFDTLTGYLRGFIDLVIEHAGRFHILDWKSNHLGDTPAHYGRAAMARAMDEQGYHLQYLLYSVALHRYLRLRLAGYDYERHFGGVLYLFVRGVRPGWTGPDGAPAGVWTHRPSLQTIEAISALLDGTREAA
jgi:exodeoxyribonuclease V beta subunit